MVDHRKVILLDVDGVLHPFSSASPFTAPCMAALRSIVEQTGAAIVLSSSWQGLPSTVAKVNAALETHGLPRVSAQTVCPNEAGYAATGADARSRASEIIRWVEANADQCTGGWVAIDDMHLQRLLPGGNFVRTEAELGLTEANAWSAVMMLGGSFAREQHTGSDEHEPVRAPAIAGAAATASIDNDAASIRKERG